MELFRVSSQSNPNSTAGAIANVVRGNGTAVLQVIGAGALNQAVKAVAIARTFLNDESIDLGVSPTFADVEINGELRTAMRLEVFRRELSIEISQPASEDLVIEARTAEGAQAPTANS